MGRANEDRVQKPVWGDVLLGENMDEISKIKPCPFCGSRKIRFDKCTKRARCAECFATSGLITPFINQGKTEEEALYMAWNRRASDA